MINYKNIINSQFYIYYLILLAILLRIIYLFQNGIVFWDGAVYIGMGKYFFTNGNIGLYEVFRPPFFGLILGLFWFLKLNPIILGKIFIFTISIISIYLTYSLGGKIFNKNVGLLAAFFLTISPTHIFYSSKVLNDNLSLFLILLIFYLVILEKNYILIGMIISIGFLTRFPNGIMLVLIGLYLIFKFYIKTEFNFKHLKSKRKIIEIINSKKFKELIINEIKLIIGFLLVALPYFIYTKIKFNSYFIGITEGSKIIELVGKSISENIYYYPKFFFIENFLIIFFIFGIYYLYKNKTKLKEKELIMTIILFILFFFTYLSSLARKEMRYLEIIFPFVYIIISYTIFKVFQKIKMHYIISIITISILIFSGYSSLKIYDETYIIIPEKDIFENYYLNQNTGLIIVSSPVLIAYQDIKPEIIYWTRPWMFEYYEKLNPNAYLINTCDLFCPKNDASCLLGKDTFINNLKENYNIEFNKKINECEYYVFKK